MIPTLIVIRQNQYIRIISEASCDFGIWKHSYFCDIHTIIYYLIKQYNTQLI